MKTFLINLDRSQDRLDSMTKSLAKIDIDFERVSGVDCDRLEKDEIEQLNKSPSINYPHPLTRGEIGCFLSHRKCWQALIESGEEWGLILEDNCEFSSVASSYFQSLDWIPDDCQLIQLTYFTGELYFDQKVDLEKKNALLRTKYTRPVGTSCYLISRKAAALALEQSQVISEPVDSFLFGMYSDYQENVHSWRLENSIARRGAIETLILGRGRKYNNNRFEMMAVHPLRLYKKGKAYVLRFFMKSARHRWLD